MRRIAHQRNKELLTRVANKLQEMCDEMTFVGGAIIGFLITDPAAPDVRFTVDVDCIINIVTHSDYYKITLSLLTLSIFKKITITTTTHAVLRLF